MTRPPRALASALLLLVSSSVVTPALAQDREADAERLFREGQKLMEERRFGEACPKFEAAYKKDGQLGTLINLAFCHKEQGAVWYAWLEFREAEVKAIELGRNDRKEFVRQRLAELDKHLPKVIIDNPQHHPLDAVLVEDRKVPEAERGAVFAAEEGRRKFTFRAKGKKPFMMLINVVKGERPQRITAPELEELPPDERGAADKAEKAEPAKPEAKPGTVDDPNPGATQRTIGWVAVGVGGVAAIVGGITGVVTLTSDDCKDQATKPCTQQEYDSINGTATISTISFIVAGVSIASGLVLVASAPSAPPGASSGSLGVRRAPPPRAATVTPRVGPGWAGVTGTFW